MSLRKNRVIRGLFFSWRQCFGYPSRKFGYLVNGATFTPPTIITNPRNVFIHAATDFEGCHISALHAKFIIKKGCAVGESLTVHTGNHARIVGKFVAEITETEKPDGYDKDIIVGEDVWIGSNVTLLAGVTVGRGTTVAAGAVVNNSMPPYCVCGGVPAKFIKFYWTIDQIIEHEMQLYPEEERLSREYLEKIYAEHNK